MKRRTIAGLLGVVTFSLIGGSILFAQSTFRVGRGQGPMTWWNLQGSRARLGVRLADLTPEKVRELKLAGEHGAVVTEVEDGSPASKAGLAANDVILEFDGERVRSVAELRRLIQDTPTDRAVEVKISRAGQTRTLQVKLESGETEPVSPDVLVQPFEMPEVHVPEFNFDFFNQGPRLGISAQDLTPQLAQYFGVSQGKGVLVAEVNAGSAAEKAGLKAGDCIVRVGDTKVESVSDLHRTLANGSNEKHQVTLTIVRDKHEQTLTAEVEPSRHKVVTPRRVAEDEFIGISPDETARWENELRSSRIALESARKALETQRLTLTRERLRMLDELRRELGNYKVRETKNTVVE